MKSYFALAALAGLAAANSNPQPLNKMLNNPQFLEFMSKQNKHYTTPMELNMRAQIYNDNGDKIAKLNAKSASSGMNNAATYEHNMFSDMTSAEFQTHLGLSPKDPSARVQSMPRHPGGRSATTGGRGNRDRAAANGEAVRSSGRQSSRGRGGRGLVADAVTVDLVKEGFMGPVKQQGSCGSCWAFAANSALEGYVAKKNNAAPVRMSEQHLVDCTLTNNSYNESLFGKTYGLWGCNGGWMSYAWWFQKEQGVMMDSDYPYTSGRTGRETQCAHDATKTKGKVTQWGQIRNSIDDVKTKLKTHPMTIAIDAGDGVFQFYKNGVIAKDAGCGTGLNHAVVLVGYTDEDDGSTPAPQPDPTPDPSPSPTPDPAVGECEVYKWWHTCKDSSNGRRLQKDANGYHNYWKIQNSWGTNWGDQGFVLFEIAEGAGVCGMNSYIEWVEM